MPIKSVFNLIYKQENWKLSYPSSSNHKPSNPKLSYILTVVGNLIIYNLKAAERRHVQFHLFWVQLFLHFLVKGTKLQPLYEAFGIQGCRGEWEIPVQHRMGVTETWNHFPQDSKIQTTSHQRILRVFFSPVSLYWPESNCIIFSNCKPSEV